MCVLSLKVPIQKKSGNLSYAPRTSIEDSVDASIRLENYIHMRGGKLITPIQNNTDNTILNRKEITRKNVKENNCMDTSSDN